MLFNSYCRSLRIAKFKKKLFNIIRIYSLFNAEKIISQSSGSSYFLSFRRKEKSSRDARQRLDSRCGVTCEDFSSVEMTRLGLKTLILKSQNGIFLNLKPRRLMKPIALALMGGKILLCRSRGFGRHKRFGRTAGIAPENNPKHFLD